MITDLMISAIEAISGSLAPNGAPSALILTVVDDTTIKLDWTDGSTNHDGHRIYISTDGVTFTEKGTVTGAITTYNAESLTAGTLYYFYIKAYKGDLESAATDTENATTVYVPVFETDFVERSLDQFVYNVRDGVVRNNLLGNSELLNQVIYGVNLSGIVAGDIVQGATDPDGGSTAWTITATAANCAWTIDCYPCLVGTEYTFSVWLRAAVNTSIALYWYDAPDYANITANITTTWQLFTFTHTVDTVKPRIFIGGGGSFTTGEVIEVWHPMVNVGNTVATYNGTPNNDWFLGSKIEAEANEPTWTTDGLQINNTALAVKKPNSTNITGTTEYTIAMLVKIPNTHVSAGSPKDLFTLNGTEVINHRALRLSYHAKDGTELPITDCFEQICSDQWVIVALIHDNTGTYIRTRKSALRSIGGTTDGVQVAYMPGIGANSALCEYGYCAIWNKAITDQSAIYNYIQSKKSGLHPDVKTQIFIDGDSISVMMATVTDYWNIYSHLLYEHYAGKAEILDVAVSGHNVNDLLTDEPTTVDPYFNSTIYDNNIVVIMIGVNHVGEDAPTVYAKIRTLCLARKAVGWKVVICTITPCSDPAYPEWQEEYRLALNVLLRANYTEFADALADVGGDATIGYTGAELDTDYYVDKVHMQIAGHAVVAPIIQTAIDSIVTI